MLGFVIFVYSTFFVNAEFSTTNSAWEDLSNQDSRISFVQATPTSVVLKWKTDEDFLRNLLTLTVHYRPRSNLIDRGTFASFQNGRIQATYGEDFSQYDWESTVYTQFYDEGKRNEMLIEIVDLKFPHTEYEFIVQRIQNDSFSVAKIVSSTAPTFVDRGPGFFEVVNTTGTQRQVRIYWIARNGRCDVSVYKTNDSDNEILLYTKANISLSDGFLQSEPISLKRHYFYIIPRDAEGQALSRLSSRIVVPAQEDVLPTPNNFEVHVDRSPDYMHTYTLRWEKPKYEDAITSYAIFWFININRGFVQSKYIFDRLYVVDHALTCVSVIIRDLPNMGLALAVNQGPYASSGLRLPEPSLY